MNTIQLHSSQTLLANANMYLKTFSFQDNSEFGSQIFNLLNSEWFGLITNVSLDIFGLAYKHLWGKVKKDEEKYKKDYLVRKPIHPPIKLNY